MTVIDDFAHHPTAVAGTLAALRARYPGRRLWGVFEPRSNTSRRRVFQREYVAALAAADRVIVGGVFQKQSDAVAPTSSSRPNSWSATCAARGVAARRIGGADEIAAAIAAAAVPGDVVALMSNGAFGGLRAKLVAALRHADSGCPMERPARIR